MSSSSFSEKYARHIVVAILIVLLCMYLFVVASVSDTSAFASNESFASTTNVTDAIAKASDAAKSKILTDLFIDVNNTKEKESMCNLITNKTYRADIFNVYFLIECMRQQELLSSSNKPEFDVAQLKNAREIISDLVSRFVYAPSTLDDAYRIAYGEGCVRDKSIRTSFIQDYNAYMNMVFKGALTDIDSTVRNTKMKSIKKAMCPLYNGNHQESITRVMNILISINHFYSKRIQMTIPRDYKVSIDNAIYQLYIIRKHVDDLMTAKDTAPITSVRRLYC